jgi:hypothetical protein
MKIDKVFLNGEVLSEDRANELYKKYVLDYMTYEGFWGGVAIITPEGTLQAEVSPA